MSDRWLYAWALGSIASGGASLLIPLYIVELGAAPVQLGLLASTAAIVGAPGAILFGRLANRVRHRKPLVLVTLLTVSVMLGLLPLLRNISAIIAVNAILWLVIASVAPVLTMLIVDDAPESRWSERIGLLNKYQGYGWAGGLVLGTIWPVIGIQFVGGTKITQTLFWLLAGCAAASFLSAIRWLPNPNLDDHVTSERKVRKIARLLSSSRRGVKGATFVFSPNRLYWTTQRINPKRLLGRLNPALMLYLFAAILFFTGFAAFWAPLPLFLSITGFESGEIFGLYLASSLASAVLYTGAGKLATKYDVRFLQSGALALRGILFPSLVFVVGTSAATFGFLTAGITLAAIGLTWAIIAVVGTAIVTRLAPPGVRGEILGVYAALGAIAGGIGGVLGGWIATFGYLTAFGVAGGFVVLGALIVVSIQITSIGNRVNENPSNPVDDRPEGIALPSVASDTENS